MKRIIITIFLVQFIFVASLDLFGYFSYNRSCEAFTSQCDPDPGGRTKSATLGHMIIDATSFFLQSHSDYQLFLKKIEQSEIYGVDYSELQTIINKAIDSIALAHSSYYEIWQTSKTLDYNPFILEKLRNFDYTQYQVDHNLNSSMFNEVSCFLSVGNVRESYEWFYNATGEILESLNILKESVNSNTIPKIKDCWRLNQKFLESELFGQYISEVFFALE